MEVFGEDPGLYLQEMGIRLYDVVDPSRWAEIVPERRLGVNYEVFFFAGADTQRRFQDDPLRYCGLLTDPVTQSRFRPSAASPRVEHLGRPYYFASDSTFTAFESTPDSFAVRTGM